ncbi:MAG TPA: hypothetical protein VGX48_17465 [Pyrinomonadaceae bacterium]|jgi:hypothetical protein|nr:hypothetical protein [Pyrinomonadaceae bacterium]
MKKKLKVILLLSLVLFCAEARAQVASPAPKTGGQPLPAEWEGVWKGTLTVAHADGKREELPMELHVGPAGAGGARGWKILYTEPGGQTTRPYEIAPAEAEPGRFVVDEKNGLFLDNQLVGRVLYSQFLVTTNVVTTRFEVQGETIAVQMSMFDVRTPRQSRLTGGDIAVFSYKFRSEQYGVLRRAKPKS